MTTVGLQVPVRARFGVTRMPCPSRFRFGPFVDACPPDQAAARLGRDLAHLYHRCRRRGWCSERDADRLATRLGLHPCRVWGATWWARVDGDP